MLHPNTMQLVPLFPHTILFLHSIQVMYILTLFIPLHTFTTSFILHFTSASIPPSTATCDPEYLRLPASSSNSTFTIVFILLSYTILVHFIILTLIHSQFPPFTHPFKLFLPTVSISPLNQSPVQYHNQRPDSDPTPYQQHLRETQTSHSPICLLYNTISINKVGTHAIAVCSCRRSSPVTLAFEPVVEINLLPRDTGLIWHPTSHSLPSPVLPRYPFIYQAIWKDEQLGELCATCLRPGSNSGQRIWRQMC